MKGRHGRGCEDRKQLYRGQWYRRTRDTWPAPRRWLRCVWYAFLPVSAGGLMDEQRKYAILFAATILADLELRHFTNAIIANPIASAAFLRVCCAAYVLSSLSHCRPDARKGVAWFQFSLKACC